MRSKLLPYLALGILLLVVAAALPALANPLPDMLVFTHVQPYDASGPPDIQDCDEIVQYTFDGGALEFDIYVQRYFVEEPLELYEFSLDSDWPEDWTLTGFEFFHEGVGDVSAAGGSLHLEATYWNCPGFAGELVPLARVFATVDGYGEFPGAGGAALLTDGCYTGTPQEIYVEGAQAAVECGYCYQDCGFAWFCVPHEQTEGVGLTVVEGAAVGTTIEFSSGDGSGQVCDTLFETSEDWLSIEVEQVSNTYYSVSVTADAENLSQGEYTGWVSAETAACKACTRIDLTVYATTAAETSSYSAVKSLY